jgi:hypothetical protein
MKAILALAALALISTGFADQLPVGRADTTATELSAKCQRSVKTSQQ